RRCERWDGAVAFDLRHLCCAGLRDQGPGRIAPTPDARGGVGARRCRHRHDAVRGLHEAREAPPDRSRRGAVPGRLGEAPAPAGGRGIHLMDATIERSALEGKLLPELQQIAQTLGVEGTQKLRKAGLIDAIVAASTNGEGSTRHNADEAVGAAGSSTSVDEPTTTGRDDGRGPDDDGDRPERDERNDREDRGDRGERNARGDRGDRQGPPRPVGQGPSDGGERDRRRRPSREERRRSREERKVRDEQDRVEELKNAPTRTGILDILPEGYGFLRTSGYLPGAEDVYVSLSYVRRHQLRKGDTVTGKIREPKNNEKYPALLSVGAVNEMDPEKAVARPQVDKLTPSFAAERFRLA